jgi:hypothetical protein
MTFEILKPCWESKKVNPSQPATKHHPEHVLGKPHLDQNVDNIFKHLKLEDTLSQEYAEQPEDDQQAYERKDNIEVARLILDESELEAEFTFAIWTFLRELEAIKVMLQSTWLQYLRGNMELMQAGFVTNTAIDLVRRAEAEFDISLKRPSKYPATQYPIGTLPMIIFYAHLDQANGKPLDFDPRMPDAVVICGCSICQFTLYVPHIMCKMYLSLLEGRKLQRVTPGNETIGLPLFSRMQTMIHSELYDAMNPSQIAEDRMRIMLPDVISIALLHRGHFFEDEIVHAGRHIYERRSIPIWVSFAFSVHLDIADLRDMLGRSPLSDLQNAVRDAKARHKIHLDWVNAVGSEVWSETQEQHYNEFTSDFYNWTVAGSFGLMRGGKEGLKDFPLTCATMKLQLFLELNLFGRTLMNDTCKSHQLKLFHQN